MPQPSVELPLGKRVSTWFRRNEKIFWVAVLVFVAISFGATFIMTSVIEDTGRLSYCTVGGVTYSERDILALRNRMTFISDHGRPFGLNVANLIPDTSRDDDRQDRGITADVLVQLLAAAREARELGIEVPPSRIHDAVKAIYKAAVYQREFYRATLTMDEKARAEFEKSAEAQRLRDGIVWTVNGYRAWLAEPDVGHSVRDFEYALELILRAKALQIAVLKSDLVSRKDLYEEFVRDRRALKLAFTAIGAEAAPDQPPPYSTEELKRYYDENGEDFLLPDRISFAYIAYPRSTFDEQVQVAEQDIQKRYEEQKRTEFLVNPVAPLPVAVYPLTPSERQEQEEAAKGLFKPLEAVKDRIEREIRAEKARNLAMTFHSQLRDRLNPPAPKDANEPAPPPATPEQLAKEYSFLRHGTTETFTKQDAEEKLGDLYNQGAVDRWFGELEKGTPLWRPTSYLTHTKKEDLPDTTTREVVTYILVRDVVGEKSQRLVWDVDTARCTEIAREKLRLRDALGKAKDRAEAMIVQIRGGKKLAEVAGGLAVAVTGPIKDSDYGTGKLVMPGGEKLSPTVEGQVFSGFFRSRYPSIAPLPLSETVMPPLFDGGGDRVFVFAIDEVVEQPDPAEFTPELEKDLRERMEWTRISRRAGTSWPSFLSTLVQKHVVRHRQPAAVRGGEEG